ncbi:MAG TPA: diacylglycerol kinase family protein [Verrucomicrobiae bacterium]|nr:diacylglycerol kinase family protein [Verrucomicrobiae bacterium]
MDKLFVIFNPAARGEKSRRVRQFLEAKAGRSVTLAPTERAGDARELAARAVNKGYRLIVAAGGDGTINEVVNGIGSSGATLGVLPLGTVNVFARELGIPGRLEAAWAVIESGRTRTIDLARAEANGATRHFVQLAGVGFDARAVRAASWELKKRLGPLSYVWAGLKTISSGPVTVEVSANGSGTCGRGVAALVGNGRFYGGRFALFPEARLDDGLLDVCIFETCGYFDVLRYGQGILRGTHPRLRGVKYFQTERLVCSASGAAPFEVDGEDAGDAPVAFSVAPRALRVVAPRPSGGDDHA